MLRRPDPLTLVVDLTRQLAEEFDTVPIRLVSTAVKSAADAVELFGNDIASSLETVERIAREDLIAVRDAATAAA